MTPTVALFLLLSTCQVSVLFGQSKDATSTHAPSSDPMNGWEEPQLAEEEDWVPPKDEPGSGDAELAEEKLEKRIAVIGVPLAFGQERDGVQNGPDWIRWELFKSMYAANCWFDDYGDTEVEDTTALDALDEKEDCGKAKFAYTDALAVQMAERAVSEVLSEDSFEKTKIKKIKINKRSLGPAASDRTEQVDKQRQKTANRAFPLTLGGDHSLAMGTLLASGRKHPNLSVIYIDAHGDINTILSSVTGHIHGMPLSFVVKDEVFSKENSNCPPFKFVEQVINANNLAFIGTRDLDPPEVAFLQRLNISAYTPAMVKELGAQEVVKQIFDKINPDRKNPVHVSFDIDSIDPLWAPSTGTAVPDGLTLTEGVELAKEIARTNTLIALDVVEVNPKIKRHRAKLTVKSAVEIILAFLSEICG